EVADALAAQPCDKFVVDSEIVAFEGRRTSFARLQGRSGLTDPDEARATGLPVFYSVFDRRHQGGYSIRDLPLICRRRLLRKASQFDDPLRFTAHRVKDGEAAYEKACRRGDEGVIAKRADAPYEGRRSANWLKFKCSKDQEFVVV